MRSLFRKKLLSVRSSAMASMRTRVPLSQSRCVSGVDAPAI